MASLSFLRCDILERYRTLQYCHPRKPAG